MNLIDFISSRVSLPASGVKNTVDLLLQDATIPFIARYRKELTGNLNEVDIELISNFKKEFENLEKRKLYVTRAIEEQGKLTKDLKLKISRSSTLAELEDIYLPYKKKRKTRADAAREAGLEPLANILISQTEKNPLTKAGTFLNKNLKTPAEALQGAKDIIAEWVNEDQNVRSDIRKLFTQQGNITSRVVKKLEKDPEAQKYKQYFNLEESLKRIPSHRFLAIYRAGNEGVLRVKVEVEKEKALEIISRKFLKNNHNACKPYILEAIEDAYDRLLKPSFQTEFLTEAKKKADEDAIGVFAENLQQLLLSAPLGNKRILAIDPGFRSGCKVVCLDENGSLLHNENIYPHPPQKEFALAGKKIGSLINAYKIESIAIGNGTASRETEIFVKKIPIEREVSVFVVNEAGASVYSASKIAREEFPNYDITVRGAVSIGRRLSDPLAELVKIDPKSIGVGQYQHEVDQTKLKDKLDMVVGSCVNRVGVNVNTASKELLSYVSGIGPALAESIIEYRRENGALRTRRDLLKIPRLGPKAYEQAAGFLRIKNGKNPLDDSAVHPERYDLVNTMAKQLGLKVEKLVGVEKEVVKINAHQYVTAELGLPTLNDILRELKKPGTDPRESITQFEFDPGIKKIEDLRTGMKLPGIINNITNFGCFVDIGIKESGLIHISKLANSFVSDVNSVVKLNQHVMVTVLDVDENQKRIQLSLVD
ncbi:RNA-binding transcriptional accessory protein [Antarcticibacterium arcticum]|uniref:RNA-binding transcriptional accessory protein n=1 Tax=Antarcticibacterium arcticum TaxID=2585771 RepID=A0A5B8YNC0_9FLAO|nr:Tex family protein [Antarcticibacterium arcticum]QED37279.1 RNA-binding transcriptional accessory protein [Antarcticibacterium arcticum]